MGFFNVLETLFFISLTITFILIIMLVYHFKNRLITLEQKCDTMFAIMSNMIKEMKDIRIEMPFSQIHNKYNTISPPTLERTNNVPPELTKIYTMTNNMNTEFLNENIYNNSIRISEANSEEDEEDEENEDEEDEDEEDEENEDDEDEEDNENTYKKIMVSDTELDSDDEDVNEDDVKVINVEIIDNLGKDSTDLESSMENSIEEIDESTIDLDDVEPEEIIVSKLDDLIDSDEYVNKPELVDYKKLDVSYLRTLVISRGLASDTKKMKKSELVKLLEQSEE